MKQLIFILLVFICKTSYPTTAKAYYVSKGKVHSLVNSLDSEERFKSECIVNIVDSYLKIRLSDKDYTNFPIIDLTVRTDFENEVYSEVWVRVTDSIITTGVISPNKLATKTLNLIEYIISNFNSLINNDFEYYEEDDDFETTLKDHTLNLHKDFRKLIINTPNQLMDSCLNVTFYRTLNDYHPIPDIQFNNTKYGHIPPIGNSPTDILYSYNRDMFDIYGNGEIITQISNINKVIETENLGTFYFDTDSSFYFLRRHCIEIFNDEYSRHVISPSISKRQTMDIGYFNIGKSKIRASNIKIEFVDFENRVICLDDNMKRKKYYELNPKKDNGNKKLYFYDKKRDQRIIMNYTNEKSYEYRRKYLYLIDEDVLITDFEKNEKDLIDSIKKNIVNN